MLDIFNIAQTAPQDKSIYYLSQIFGPMSGVLNSDFQPGDIESTLLGNMFKTFNTALLAVGALIVVYVIIVGTLKTAHEGEVMGKQWNSIWIPLRIVMGIVGLVPTASGYCVIQLVMMWVIIQGVGAADSLWKTTLGFVASMGSPYAQVTIPTSGVTATMHKLFQGVTCDVTMHMAVDSPGPSGPSNPQDTSSLQTSYGTYWCNGINGANPFCYNGKPGTPFDPNTDTYQMGPGGICGTLKYCNVNAACPNGMKSDSNEATVICKMCAAQVFLLANTISSMQLAALNFSVADFEYRTFIEKKVVMPVVTQYCQKQGWSGAQCSTTANTFPAASASLPSGGSDPQNAGKEAIQDIIWPAIMPQAMIDGQNFMQINISNYTTMMQKIAKDSSGPNTISGSANSFNPADTYSFTTDQLKSNGWLYAGSFYYVIGKTNGTNQQSVPSMEVNLSKDIMMPVDSNPYEFVRINRGAASDLITIMQQQQSSNQSSGGQTGGTSTTAPDTGGDLGDPSTGDLNSSISGFQTDISNSFSNNASPFSGTNPIFAAQAIGFGLLTALGVFFAAFLIATAVIGYLVGNLDPSALGNFLWDPIGPGSQLLYMFLVPALYGLMGIMATYGGLLGVYVPLIPFMVFTASAVTWFLLVMEAMVAGPLVAIGIMMPGGQHEMMGRAEPAIMMLFNIFLRPSLMIIGLMAGMLISTVLCDLIFITFWQIFIPVAGSPGIALLAWVFYLGAFVAMIVSAINKSYTLIYLLPERVITWIGGHAAQGGEADMAHEAKGAIEGAGRGMGSAAQQTAAGAQKMKEAGDQKASQNQQADKANKQDAAAERRNQELKDALSKTDRGGSSGMKGS